jgi:hypothetical protein
MNSDDDEPLDSVGMFRRRKNQVESQLAFVLSELEAAC